MKSVMTTSEMYLFIYFIIHSLIYNIHFCFTEKS